MLRNTWATSCVRIITETGLRVYNELMPMKKQHLDLENAVVWIPDSKTPNGVAEVPLTPTAVEASRDQFHRFICLRAVRICFRVTKIRAGIRRLCRQSGTRPCDAPASRISASSVVRRK